MDKIQEEIKTSVLDELNEIANDLGWNVDYSKDGYYRVIGKSNSVLYSSKNPYEVAFYMGDSIAYRPGLSM